MRVAGCCSAAGSTTAAPFGTSSSGTEGGIANEITQVAARGSRSRVRGGRRGTLRTAAGSASRPPRPAMLTPVARARPATPLHHRRRHARERLPVRVDPGRDLALDARTRNKLDLYVNHETSLVPFPYTPRPTGPPAAVQRLHNSLVSHLASTASTRRRPSRLVRDLERRNSSGSARTSSPTRRSGFDRRCSSRTRRGSTGSTGRASRSPRRSARPTPPDRRRRRASTRRTARRGRSGAWAVTTTRTASPSRATAIPSSSRATTRSSTSRAVAALLVHRRRLEAVWRDEGDLWAFVADGVDDYYDFSLSST